MTDPTPLSPAAQAVLDAVKDELDHAPWEMSYLAGSSAAAALRAAADQVVPMALCVHNDDFVYVRHQLHTIAAELEGTNPSESD